MHVHIQRNACLHIHTYIHTYICMYVRICIYIYTYICIYIYICFFIYVCVYAHTGLMNSFGLGLRTRVRSLLKPSRLAAGPAANHGAWRATGRFRVSGLGLGDRIRIPQSKLCCKSNQCYRYLPVICRCCRTAVTQEQQGCKHGIDIYKTFGSVVGWSF